LAGGKMAGALNLPTRKRFSTRVMQSMIQGQLNGETSFDWRAERLVCQIEIPLVT
jgi:hypothetical protein